MTKTCFWSRTAKEKTVGMVEQQVVIFKVCIGYGDNTIDNRLQRQAPDTETSSDIHSE